MTRTDSTARLLRLPEVMQLTGLSKTTIYRWMPAGTFPKSHGIGPKAKRWLSTDIEDWIQRQVTA